jgi:hypothetical protein
MRAVAPFAIDSGQLLQACRASALPVGSQMPRDGPLERPCVPQADSRRVPKQMDASSLATLNLLVFIGEACHRSGSRSAFYQPETERWSHYSKASLPLEFDAQAQSFACWRSNSHTSSNPIRRFISVKS